MVKRSIIIFTSFSFHWPVAMKAKYSNCRFKILSGRIFIICVLLHRKPSKTLMRNSKWDAMWIATAIKFYWTVAIKPLQYHENDRQIAWEVDAKLVTNGSKLHQSEKVVVVAVGELKKISMGVCESLCDKFFILLSTSIMLNLRNSRFSCLGAE